MKNENPIDHAHVVLENAPEDSLEAAFAKLGGKKVRGATPTPSAEPDPEAFAEMGGKYVGKAPAPPPNSRLESKATL